MKKEDKPVVVEETFNKSVEEVWSAITELDQMVKWYFDNIPEFKPEVGFETKFIVKSEERTFPHLWKIVEVIPNKKIKYNWKYENYPGDSYVTFELFDEEGSTKLVVTNEVVEDFPNDIPEFKRESCKAGWNYFIKERLKNFLDGR
jgi:uncharacterized protein YndB with AHSA1/START domain